MNRNIDLKKQEIIDLLSYKDYKYILSVRDAISEGLNSIIDISEESMIRLCNIINHDKDKNEIKKFFDDVKEQNRLDFINNELPAKTWSELVNIKTYIELGLINYGIENKEYESVLNILNSNRAQEELVNFLLALNKKND